jgi:hypothetical protein
VQVSLAPTLDVTGAGVLKLGVSLDHGAMATISDRLMPAPDDATSPAQRDWNTAVEQNLRIVHARFPAQAAGRHTIKIWRLDDNVVVEAVHVQVVPN